MIHPGSDDDQEEGSSHIQGNRNDDDQEEGSIHIQGSRNNDVSRHEEDDDNRYEEEDDDNRYEEEDDSRHKENDDSRHKEDDDSRHKEDDDNHHHDLCSNCYKGPSRRNIGCITCRRVLCQICLVNLLQDDDDEPLQCPACQIKEALPLPYYVVPYQPHPPSALIRFLQSLEMIMRYGNKEDDDNLFFQVMTSIRPLMLAGNHGMILDHLRDTMRADIRAVVDRCHDSYQFFKATIPKYQYCSTCHQFMCFRTICFLCGTLMDPYDHVSGYIGDGEDDDLVGFEEASLQCRSEVLLDNMLVMFEKECQSHFDTEGGDMMFLSWSIICNSRASTAFIEKVESHLQKMIRQWSSMHVNIQYREYEEEEDEKSFVANTLEGLYVLHQRGITTLFAEATNDDAATIIASNHGFSSTERLTQKLLLKKKAWFDDLVSIHEEVPMTSFYYCPHCAYDNDPNNPTSRRCSRCHHQLKATIDYAALLESIVWVYVAHELELCDDDGVFNILPEVRNQYQSLDAIGKNSFIWQGYFITHFIYVHSEWGKRQLMKELYMEEFEFMLANMDSCIAIKSYELVAEFVHCLFVLGAKNDDRYMCKNGPIMRGIVFLISLSSLTKIPVMKESLNKHYSRYHTAYCVIVAIMHFLNK